MVTTPKSNQKLDKEINHELNTLLAPGKKLNIVPTTTTTATVVSRNKNSLAGGPNSATLQPAISALTAAMPTIKLRKKTVVSMTNDKKNSINQMDK